MNILHLDTEMTWRGGENQVRLLIKGLQEHGDTCVLVAKPDSQILKKIGPYLIAEAVSMGGGWDIFAARKIAKLCRKYHIQVVDCQTGNAHSLGILVKWFYPSVKLVVHRRVDFPPKKNGFSRWKYLTPQVDHYIAISQCIRSILLQAGIPPARVTTVCSAVDDAPYRSLDRRQARETLLSACQGSPETILIGNASALSPQKGYDVLLKSLTVLLEKGSPFHCFIAGDGELREELKELSRKLGVCDHVTFLGHIENVGEFLSGLDILAMPSHFEGLGTLILEGIYAGCCVVATEVGGIPEMIRTEHSGLLCTKGDWKTMGAHLQRVCESATLRETYNSHAKAHVLERFSLQAMVRGNREVYQSVLKGVL